MSEENYYHKLRDLILKRAKDYYENDKGRLKEQAKNKYKDYLKKKKNVEREREREGERERRKERREREEETDIIIGLKKRNKN